MPWRSLSNRPCSRHPLCLHCSGTSRLHLLQDSAHVPPPKGSLPSSLVPPGLRETPGSVLTSWCHLSHCRGGSWCLPKGSPHVKCISLTKESFLKYEAQPFLPCLSPSIPYGIQFLAGRETHRNSWQSWRIRMPNHDLEPHGKPVKLSGS